MRMRRFCLRIGFLAGMAALLAAPSFAARPGTAGAATVTGVVRDLTGSTVSRARVALLTTSSTEVRTTYTGDEGRFTFDELQPATYVLCIEKAGFREFRESITLRVGQGVTLDVVLTVGFVAESVTVTAARGSALETRVTPQDVSVTPVSELARRSFSLFPQALAEDPGVHVQQTSTSQGSPFVRGLTGQQILFLVDGVRYNNATFRPGANQYSALIDPAFVDRVEVVHGPTAAQYGSDSLGGTVNVLTAPGVTRGDRGGWHGSMTVAGASADLSAGASAFLAVSHPKWGATTVGGSARRNQDLRTGHEIDSHSVVTRLLGLPSAVLGTGLNETAYSQYGANAKVLIHPRTSDALTVQYLRGNQAGASRYDQLDGGVGNLIHRFDPQVLDFVTARYDRVGTRWFDQLSATFSLNSQRDDRTYQSVNNSKLGLRSPISDEHNRTNAFGYQAQVARQVERNSLVFGGELYDEHVDSTRQDFNYNKTSGTFSDVAAVRGRFPNGAGYRTFGVFAQDVVPLSSAWTASAAVRYSGFRYNQSAQDNLTGPSGPLVPTYDTSFGDVTFNAGVVYAASSRISVTANVSRGFRAPNVNDFGSIGLSGGGFEVSPDEAIRVDGSVALMSGSSVVAGQIWPAAPLRPERLMSYEIGVRAHAARFSATLTAFDSEIRDLIERRTIIMAPGAVGQTIGGQTIIRQDPSGTVYTALSSSAVFVRTNAGRVRLRGAEATMTARLAPAISLNGNVSYVWAVDLVTGLPPNLENGIPPTHGFFGVRWQPPRARWWVEAYSLFAATQTRFSTNDLGQARIGGIRTKQEITDFFNNGAVARDLVGNGILLPTGETLSQVLTRVLGPDVNARVPFMTSNPGFATMNLRAGFKLADWAHLTVIGENLLDKNYRTMGSGIDGAGRSVAIRQAFTF